MARMSTEERQEQIINQAIKIIHEKGYTGLGIRELAGQVGISEPAIYRHFASKEDIVLGILDRLLQMGDTLEKHLDEFENAKEKIRRFIEFHFDFLDKNPQLTSVVFSENVFQPNTALKTKLQQIVANRFRILSAVLQEAKQQGLIVDIDTDDLTFLIIGNIRMIVMDWRISNFGFDLTERGKRALGSIDKLIFLSDNSV